MEEQSKKRKEMYDKIYLSNSSTSLNFESIRSWYLELIASEVVSRVLKKINLKLDTTRHKKLGQLVTGLHPDIFSAMFSKKRIVLHCKDDINLFFGKPLQCESKQGSKILVENIVIFFNSKKNCIGCEVTVSQQQTLEGLPALSTVHMFNEDTDDSGCEV